MRGESGKLPGWNNLIKDLLEQEELSREERAKGHSRPSDQRHSPVPRGKQSNLTSVVRRQEYDRRGGEGERRLG